MTPDDRRSIRSDLVQSILTGLAAGLLLSYCSRATPAEFAVYLNQNVFLCDSTGVVYTEATLTIPNPCTQDRIFYNGFEVN